MKNKQQMLSAIIIAIIASFSFLGCKKDNTVVQQPPASLSANALMSNGSVSNINGRGGAREVYYDATLFTVNMREFSDQAAAKLIAHNGNTNIIYATNDLEDPQDFNSVIDAIPTDGFNPLWVRFQIVFNPGFTPHQFFSDDQVTEAASGSNPEITLINTSELYRCSVIGPH